MEGYHGTKPQSLESILKTKTINVTSFSITGDFIIKDKQSLPNDLGQGLYLFVDDDSKGYCGLTSAKSYARIYRSENRKIGVIKFKINCENINDLNMSHPQSIKFFNTYKQKYYNRVKSSLSRLKKNRALDRYNLDGIFLEHLLRYNGNFSQINVVSCDSYVPLTQEKPIPISSIPNGREVCVRDTTMIDWANTRRVYNGL